MDLRTLVVSEKTAVIDLLTRVVSGRTALIGSITRLVFETTAVMDLSEFLCLWEEESGITSHVNITLRRD